MLSLALGIGANTTIFTFVRAVLLRELPVSDPDRLVSIYTTDRKNPGLLPCSYPNYRDLRDQTPAFSGMALYSITPMSLTGRGEPRELTGQLVSGNYFDVLGIRPAAGRFFLPEEDRAPGANPVAVLSYHFWSETLGADPGAIGRPLSISGHDLTIVGIAPKGFQGVNGFVATDIWVPLMMYREVFPIPQWVNERRALIFSSFARLRDGFGVESAEAATRTVFRSLEQAYPTENEGRTVAIAPLSAVQAHTRGRFVRAGLVLMVVVGFVLLIACANVANLLLARATGRTREIAIRLAMGAGRVRIVRQLLAESSLIAILGGAAGILFALWGRSFLWSTRPPALLDAAFQPSIDMPVLLFTGALSILAGLLFGIAPALQATRPDLASELKDRAGRSGAAPGWVRLRNTLVVLQVGLSVIALAGSSLFLHSLENARHLNPGFDAEHLLIVSFNLGTRGNNEARGREFQRQLLSRLRSLAGVRAATIASNAPFGNALARSIFIEGQEPPAGGRGYVAVVDSVEPGFLTATGTPLLRGRDFRENDTIDSPPVAIVNETMANRFWPQQDPIGKRFLFFSETKPVEVVGVARTANYLVLGEDPRTFLYLPMAQRYTSINTVHVRADGDPAALVATVRREIQSLDPNLLLTNVQTVRDLIGGNLWAPRMGAIVLGAFGLLALALASVGIYGVVSYSVNQRVREIGVRLALGAQPSQVLREVIREGMRTVGIGVAAGVGGAVALTRLVVRLLFGISGVDPISLVLAAALLIGVALLACYIPARRATRVDPTVALREF